MTKNLRLILIALAAVFLGACSTIDRSAAPAVDRQALWVVLPFANHTETPLAGQRAEAISEAILHSNGVNKIKRYPSNLQQEALFDAGERKQQEEALAWARQQGARYALTGAVDEWRYKVGVDGEPAAGVALYIIDVASGETLWSASGGKSGWSREALSAVAQQLIRNLLGAGLSAAH
jgi:PBP1b-binding outer membrane lipoprotein LpoB